MSPIALSLLTVTSWTAAPAPVAAACPPPLAMIVAGPALASTVPSLSTPPPMPRPAPGMDWFDGTYAEALEAARTRETLVMVEFRTSWCGWCKTMEAETWSEASVTEAAEALVCLRLDAESPEGAPLAQRFAVQGFPTLVFLTPDDEPEDIISGYIPPQPLLAELDRIGAGRGTLSDLRRVAAADPADLQTRFQLALRLWDIGDDVGHDEVMASIRRDDPEERSLPMRRMQLGQLREELFGCQRNGDVVDFAPILAFLEEETHGELLFEGWSYVARVKQALGERTAARDASVTALEYAPPGRWRDWANAVAYWFWEDRENLTDEQKDFAVSLAEQACDGLVDPPGLPSVLADYLDTLACCYDMAGRRNDAIDTAKQAVRLAPDREVLREHLAEFRRRR